MGEVKGLVTASDSKECGRCGRKLRDRKSIERGYGRWCCWKKHQKEKAKEQFEKRQQQLFDSRSA